MSSETKTITLVNQEINKELADPAIVRALLATTFKNFDEKLMRQAIFEGVVRGFPFKSFLQKDVYAIKYGNAYNLVTSVDYARKIGMRSGVIGKSAPTFEMDGDKIEACSVTIKRKVGDDVGEFTSLVYFDEYSTGQNLWKSKPRTMIAKVAEMHALRMACPEEMAKVYTSEEFDKENAREGSYTVKHTQHETYDGEEIKDDAQVTSTGDDMPGFVPPTTTEARKTPSAVANEVVIPESATERRKVILELVAKADPQLDVTDRQAVGIAIADLTQLEYTESNYANIIHLLSR